ncbi:MAG: YraN family protein, partial [Eggerthellaceae bacterium]|nr:YraN family protein [Eggerthellaceae bacterium]
MNDELKNRMLEATVAYLKARDYEILETAWTCEEGTIDVIAKDEGDLVLVNVAFSTSACKGFPRENLKREELEKLAALYLATSEHVNVGVRFDTIGIIAVAPDRA